MKVGVIGSGFAGIAAATKLAQQGFEVHVFEKNKDLGGRARLFEEKGFRFDMGPSWYWMPDVFDNYFKEFGKKTSHYYNLVRLDPSYSVVFSNKEVIDLPALKEELFALFEKIEPGVTPKLEEFWRQSAYKYEVGIGEFVWKPSTSFQEFLDPRLVTKAFSLDLFASFSKHIRKFFKDEKLLKIMEFPVLFLGATPENTPALYSLMNYAEMALGTWYPMGGMNEIIKGMVSLAEEMGVIFHTDSGVKKVMVENGTAKALLIKNEIHHFDVIVAGADYHHVEQSLLEPTWRNYSENYWSKRTMAPSSLLFYLGVEGKIPKLKHHNLFFDEDFKLHAEEIYENPKWPSKPLFYACVPSKTDPSVAPEGDENLFILIPIAPDLDDPEELREKYFHIVLDRLEAFTGSQIKERIAYKKSFAVKDFISEYNSFKGNAYGLANTLKQTAILKPTLRNKKVSNLFYTGQLTVPGPGVPPSLISGLVVAKEVGKKFKPNTILNPTI